MRPFFVGRKAELAELWQIQSRKSANLVIMKGRRRIGKSRLIEEFAKNQKFYCFTGVAPTKEMTKQMQLDEFTRQLCEELDLPKITMDDWGDAFTFLHKVTAKDKVVILFDEISWMGYLDPTFTGKLKNAWDTQFKKNTRLMLVLCGSVSSWIEENIISSTLFLGRPSLYLSLQELSLSECAEFWGKHADQISAYEKLKLLSITGGVPRYLEFINSKLTAEENIRLMCFSPNAPLVNEFDRIFSDIFGKRSKVYKEIIKCLVNGSASLTAILKKCDRGKTGDFSKYLSDLEAAGFISRDFTWHLKDAKQSKFSRYRLKDNYVRFYLKYIEPNKGKIKKGFFKEKSITTLAGWSSLLALQFENLVLNNSIGIIKRLGIHLEEVISLGPYFQKETKTTARCQIDLLIQTKFNGLFVCEIKFSKHPIPFKIIEEMKTKIGKMKIPRHFSCRPVLIHVNGVQAAVTETYYFAKVIDFSELLKK